MQMDRGGWSAEDRSLADCRGLRKDDWIFTFLIDCESLLHQHCEEAGRLRSVVRWLVGGQR